MTSKQSLFMLDPDVVFLNHGSFGATPRPVFETYQAWQQKLEQQPVRFLARELAQLLLEARQALATYVGCKHTDLVLLPNVTTAVNVVARSIQLQPGDEVLASDHEYGACVKAWQFACRQSGAHYRTQPIPTPLGTTAEIVDAFWSGVTERTRAIFISHITSPTAVRLPIEVIVHRARKANILTVIDGAHAPGQVSVDLTGLNADFYCGNCHKWLMAPKGAGFLYVTPRLQELIQPLVVSWGWGSDSTVHTGSPFQDLFEWTGTIDPAALLAIPAAIRFQQDQHWPSVRGMCHDMVKGFLRRACEILQAPSFYHDMSHYAQMAALSLPAGIDPVALQNHLYDEYHIEVPCFEWNGKPLLRISVQGYNSGLDLDRLCTALEKTLCARTGNR